MSSNPELPLLAPGLNDFCFMLMRTTKLKIPTIPHADKDAEKLDVSDVAGGMQNGTTLLEKSGGS